MEGGAEFGEWRCVNPLHVTHIGLVQGVLNKSCLNGFILVTLDLLESCSQNVVSEVNWPE